MSGAPLAAIIQQTTTKSLIPTACVPASVRRAPSPAQRLSDSLRRHFPILSSPDRSIGGRYWCGHGLSEAVFARLCACERHLKHVFACVGLLDALISVLRIKTYARMFWFDLVQNLNRSIINPSRAGRCFDISPPPPVLFADTTAVLSTPCHISFWHLVRKSHYKNCRMHFTAVL